MNKPITPIQIDAPSEEKEEEKRIPFFYIGEIEYTLPEKIHPNVVTQYLRDVRKQGEAYALAEGYARLIGEDALDDLAECDTITDEQVAWIMNQMQERLMGAVNKAAGKSRAARRKSSGS